MFQENSVEKVVYEVIEQIEVLREYASGILGDIYRVREKNPDPLLEELEKSVGKLRNNVYCIESMKEAYILRGKLQMAAELTEKANLKAGEEHE